MGDKDKQTKMENQERVYNGKTSKTFAWLVQPKHVPF